MLSNVFTYISTWKRVVHLHPPPPQGWKHSLEVLLSKEAACENSSERQEKFSGSSSAPSGPVPRLVLIICCLLFVPFRWGEERSVDGTSRKYWVGFLSSVPVSQSERSRWPLCDVTRGVGVVTGWTFGLKIRYE